MILTIDVTMDYAVQPGDPALLAITVMPSDSQSIQRGTVTVDQADLYWIDGEGGMGQRVWATPHGTRLYLKYSAHVTINRSGIPLDRLQSQPMQALPAGVLHNLRPSLFCPSDRFVPFVQQEFGFLYGGAKIAAMRDWVARALIYSPGASDAGTTALDTFVTRQGVCRDYAHLMCAFARAAGVPARYVSGYSPGVAPPDFHACAEIWLDGGWHLVDPTGMSTPDSFAVIAVGQDAGDVAFMETAGMANVMYQEVRVRWG